ncbi:MSMEG_0567/Sll0786 family nitrogen starvation N-acetyltransferase [Nitratireductor sp. ZSWI3]|uniref:MSMEG_0567/Sll0786 family nitrogen starvation N-acetyltransferase n=1 Tax=Nitratireductor sp. ZSWI3 TaxID=2966359 RepID=UPI0021500846|nr:MSMEG_0567/Sll0786 family nitrogen starvation N-acetyltransferase [Nitratireductor sp. ZSWI3]MCR4265180.1 GNAT family N-acetyltransferase [Nitratireductor sp. ZSWI3]
MSELVHFHSPGYFIRAASTRWEASGAAELRRRVFVDEQAIFRGDDRDDIDLIATHLVALSTLAHEPDHVVGTVRIHQEEPGLWWGSRLAVDSGYRRVGRLGAELIRLAVSTANARGCHTFLAHVQMQNIPLFRRLHWHGVQEEVHHGVPHLRMSADLTKYPPIANPDTGWYFRPKRAA